MQQHTFHIEHGSIMSTYSDKTIERPALLADKASGTVHGCGEANALREKYDAMSAKLRAAGLNDMAGQLMLIEFDPGKISREDACYIMCRALEYSASSFVPELCRLLESGEDAAAWLESEKARVPIDVVLE